MTKTRYTPVPKPLGQIMKVDLVPGHPGGFPIDGEYVERFVTPIVGPSIILLVRSLYRMAYQLSNSSIDVETRLVAASIGLSYTPETHSRMYKTVQRAHSLAFLRYDFDTGVFALPTHRSQLNAKQINRLHPELERQHTEYLDAIEHAFEHAHAIAAQ